MKKVTILAFQNAMATTIIGPMDILNQAGRLWQSIHDESPTPFFEVTLATADGLPVKCDNNIFIQPHCAINTIEKTDLILIAAVANIGKTVKYCPEVIPWIRGQFECGTHVASICTGAFLLAKTGLLDGKSATLHWGFAKSFRRMFPTIDLKLERILIDHGKIYCSAGTNAGLDLALYLVEKFCGRQVAVQCAKAMVFNMGRNLQTPYADFLFSKDHGDEDILAIQKWLEENHAHPMEYDRLARNNGMSRRSLERRFKRATGVTPLAYLQQLRIESAKRLIESGTYSLNEVAYAVGYEDLSFFRKLFVRLAGIPPKEYWQRFIGYPINRIDQIGRIDRIDRKNMKTDALERPA